MIFGFFGVEELLTSRKKRGKRIWERECRTGSGTDCTGNLRCTSVNSGLSEADVEKPVDISMAKLFEELEMIPGDIG